MFWKPHPDNAVLIAFTEGQSPSQNLISSSEGFKTSSKYDGNNCLWISPRNLGGIFFLLLKIFFKKKEREIAACVVLGKEEEPPDVLCRLFRCSKYNPLWTILGALFSVDVEERSQRGSVGAWPLIYHGKWGYHVTLIPQWPKGPMGKGK